MIHTFECLSCRGVYRDASQEGGTYHHACPPLPADKKGKGKVRANARDENLTWKRAGDVPRLRSEGAGVRCISHPRLHEPPWITALKASPGYQEEDD
jgi:hypothetical protein